MAMSMSPTSACTLLQSAENGKGNPPQSNYKLVAFEGTEFKRLRGILQIADAGATLTALSEGPLIGPPAGPDAIDCPPYLLRSQGSALQRNPLGGDGSFVLGTANSEIPRMHLQHSTDVAQAVLRFAIRLVKGEMDILWKTNLSS